MQITNLKGYLGNKNMTLKKFSQTIDCNPDYLSMIITGRRFASRRLAKDVKAATEGLIDLPTRPRKKE